MQSMQRRTYVAPTLTEHGSVVSSTLGGPQIPPYESANLTQMLIDE